MRGDGNGLGEFPNTLVSLECPSLLSQAEPWTERPLAEELFPGVRDDKAVMPERACIGVGSDDVS